MVFACEKLRVIFKLPSANLVKEKYTATTRV